MSMTMPPTTESPKDPRDAELDATIKLMYQEAAELNLVRSLGLTPRRSSVSNRWYIQWGDSPFTGVVGRGDSPMEAVRDFNSVMLYGVGITKKPGGGFDDPISSD